MYENLIKELRCDADCDKLNCHVVLCIGCKYYHKENRKNKSLIERDAANAIESLQAEIKQLQEERRWIPVAERLPNVDEYGDVNVLCCMDDGFIASATYDKNNGWELWDESGEVTHWMELPQPPKGEPNEQND